jgi:uncharacterized iron-regulated protein
MSYEADPRVDEYIDALLAWQQQIAARCARSLAQAPGRRPLSGRSPTHPYTVS